MLAVARSIGEHMSEYKVVITKSTVPVGTGDNVRADGRRRRSRSAQRERSNSTSSRIPNSSRKARRSKTSCSPDRIVVGTDNPRIAELLRALYDPFTRNRERSIVMDLRSAELTKYAANAMLATKISFMNELANLAERFGADIEKVRVGIGSDPRIGYHFIYPGLRLRRLVFPEGRAGAGALGARRRATRRQLLDCGRER